MIIQKVYQKNFQIKRNEQEKNTKDVNLEKSKTKGKKKEHNFTLKENAKVTKKKNIA